MRTTCRSCPASRRVDPDHRGGSGVQAIEGTAEVSDRLTNALLILDESETHEPLITGAKSHAGRHGDVGLTYQHRGELDRARVRSAGGGADLDSGLEVVDGGVDDLGLQASSDEAR